MDKNRLSRPSLFPKNAPRQSVFAGSAASDAHTVCSPFLFECVAAMEDCCDEAHEAQELLRQGTYDLPRISRVIQPDRQYLLVAEHTVRQYKADITDEVEPQVSELLSRAERGLGVLLKKEGMLQTKVENLEQTKSTARSAVNTAGMKKLDARRIQMLVRQREHLEQEMSALQAEIDALVRIFSSPPS
ncbi:hypothetical protein BDW22DRAFT_1333745 [Trametopsis cervina]|nr:hypothetical protein BDW22DRAFT_1333745 [Trametopsis cervina]